MDGWNTTFLLGPGLFSGALAVSFRECISSFSLIFWMEQTSSLAPQITQLAEEKKTTNLSPGIDPGNDMAVSKNRGIGYPQNGWFLNNGSKPYEQMDDLGGFKKNPFKTVPIFGLTPIWRSQRFGWYCTGDSCLLAS